MIDYNSVEKFCLKKFQQNFFFILFLFLVCFVLGGNFSLRKEKKARGKKALSKAFRENEKIQKDGQSPDNPEPWKNFP